MTAAEDLTPWLHAQLDEDERDGGIAHCPGCEGGESECDVDLARARVLAEVDAKRRIIDSWEASQDDNLPPLALIALDEVVKALALPYVDRPGYREEWRP